MELQGNPSPVPSAMPQGYVHLNVGGTCYTTSLSTLTRYPGSMLHGMFTQENIPLAKDHMGRYIIDRDGSVFRYILNFLRGGNLNLPPRFADYEQLKEEVDFYQLDEMKELLELWRIMNWTDSYRHPRPRDPRIYQTEGQHFHCNIDFNQGALGELAEGRHGHCDAVSFKYIANFLCNKGSFMPKNQEELKKLKAVIYGTPKPTLI